MHYKTSDFCCRWCYRKRTHTRVYTAVCALRRNLREEPRGCSHADDHDPGRSDDHDLSRSLGDTTGTGELSRYEGIQVLRLDHREHSAACIMQEAEGNKAELDVWVLEEQNRWSVSLWDSRELDKLEIMNSYCSYIKTHPSSPKVWLPSNRRSCLWGGFWGLIKKNFFLSLQRNKEVTFCLLCRPGFIHVCARFLETSGFWRNEAVPPATVGGSVAIMEMKLNVTVEVEGNNANGQSNSCCCPDLCHFLRLLSPLYRTTSFISQFYGLCRKFVINGNAALEECGPWLICFLELMDLF